MLAKARRIWRDEGTIELVRRAIKFGYNTHIRPLLPKKAVLYNDIPVHASHMGDSVVPWHTTDIPGYENALVQGIRQYVEKGDTVVAVGGGWGVSTVAAATQAGENGQVITYEGGNHTVEKVKDTVQLNNVDDRVSVRHAIVGQAMSLRDNGSGATAVRPTELPDCDVLVLDCEGTEMEILSELDIRPSAIIVETHGLYGATKAKVRNKLNSAGYDVVKGKIAEERLQTFCENNDIYVLHSVFSND